VHNAPTPPDAFEPWEIETIEAVVQDFLSTRQPTALLQFDDLVQELRVHWWLRRGKYQADRGASAKTYLNRLAKRKLIDLERELNAAKRGGGRSSLSLDQPVGNDGEVSLGALLEAPQEPERMAAALERAMSRLSERQQRIVTALEVSGSRSEAARRAGISRDTFYAELDRIIQVCRDEGLEDYLY